MPPNNSEDKFRDIKNFLITNNPSKIDAENREEVLAELVHSFHAIFEPIRTEPQGISDTSRLLIVDLLSIWILRTTQIISNKKIETDKYKQIVNETLLSCHNATTIFQYVITFWSDGSAAFVNALSDMFGKLLRLIKLIFPANTCEDMLSHWLNSALKVPATLRVQYYLINALSTELDLFPVLQKRPDFVESSLSLMWSDSLSTPIGKCLTSLLTNVYNIHFLKDKEKITPWLELWYEPSLKYLCNSKLIKPIELYVLTPLFKIMPDEAFIAFSKRINALERPILIINIFRLGQELAIEEEPFHENKLISLETVESFLRLDAYKLQAFELLTFSVKRSRKIHEYIFELIKENIDIFFQDAEVETRNYFCSSFKHFILRIRDSSYALNRTLVKLRAADKFPEEQKEKQRDLKTYEDFLLWLSRYLKIKLCPGTQYSEIYTALRICEFLIVSGIDKSVSEKYIDVKDMREWPFFISFCSDLSLARLLLDVLSSHFDDIRKIAKRLLLIIFDSSEGQMLQGKLNWKKFEQTCTDFMDSYQYADIGAVLQCVLYDVSDNKHLFLEELLEKLRFKTADNIHDYIKHLNQPISSYFTSMSLLLNENALEPNELKHVVQLCISLILENWSSVKKILCYDTAKETLPTSYQGSLVGDQVVISTAFKTVKECSNLLNTILNICPLSSEQLTVVGNLLIEQLFSIYHSGAFQAVLPSFQTCCRRAHKENPLQIEEWLEDITDILEFKTQYITRRSGGIPSMISTILSTENKKDRPLLRTAYFKLEKIASRPIDKHQDVVDLPQINAFNCIRAIFIESKLSEPCTPYISSALALSLKNFTSDLWSLRNCSIMLFTSLQNRIFGKKGKNVGASQFFARFKGIREILLQLLKNSLHVSSNTTEKLKRPRQVESIFLVLNILLRLKPTPGYDGMEPFANEVILCLNNKSWKIRDMAARTLPHLIEGPLKWSAASLSRTSVTNQNSLHGHLLVAAEVLKDVQIEETLAEGISALVDAIFAKQTEFLLRNRSYHTVKAYVELVDLLFRKVPLVSKDERTKTLVSHVGEYYLKHDGEFVADGSKQMCLSCVLSFLLKHDHSSTMILCELGIRSEFFEVQLVALQFAIDYLDLQAMDCNCLMVAISELSQDVRNLPKINAVIITAMNKSCRSQISDVLAILENPLKSEEEHIAELTSLGGVSGLTPGSDNELLISGIISKYLDDSLPVDFRLASINSLDHYLGTKTNPELVLRVIEMLTDDDYTVRVTAARLLCDLFSLKGRFKEHPSPCTVAKKTEQILFMNFSKEVVGNLMAQKLKVILASPNMQCIKNKKLEGLFEPEKNNQFRNEVEQSIHYASIISQASFRDADFTIWVNKQRSKLLNFLRKENFSDTPLGWSSKPDVFANLCVLRLLTKFTEPLQLGIFDQELRAHDIHPMVFERVCI